MSEPWVVTTGYTTLELATYILGFVLWGVAYVVVVYNILTKKYCEIPFMAVAANVTWEFVWSWFFTVDMGLLLQWIYRSGWALDVFITYGAFRYGQDQITNPRLRPYFRPAFAFALVAWVPTYYYFAAMGYDLPLGSNSAYICNVVDSGVYLLVALGLSDLSKYSPTVAWTKMLGTAFVTVFTFLKYPDNHFVHCLGIVVFVLDCAYIALLHRRQGGAK